MNLFNPSLRTCSTRLGLIVDLSLSILHTSRHTLLTTLVLPSTAPSRPSR